MKNVTILNYDERILLTLTQKIEELLNMCVGVQISCPNSYALLYTPPNISSHMDRRLLNTNRRLNRVNFFFPIHVPKSKRLPPPPKKKKKTHTQDHINESH